MNKFKIILPLKKDLGNQLIGIASTTSVDRDDEKMSHDALQMMVGDIKREGVNLFSDHQHEWENTMGVIKDADLIGDQVQVKIDLDDCTTNPKIPMLLNKLKKGIKLGLSVGGNVTGFKWEYDRNLGKKIKVLDKVKIYEVSIVGIPSNADSYLTIPQAIAKSVKLNKSRVGYCPYHPSTKLDDKGECDDCERELMQYESPTKKCPVCLSIMNKKCPICFYKSLPEWHSEESMLNQECKNCGKMIKFGDKVYTWFHDMEEDKVCSKCATRLYDGQ